jgi:hypothetical protein
MQSYEYKVVPAPERGQKARGVKTPQDRFAHAMTETLNRLAAEGWEYHRAETLPCAESKGFFSGGKESTVYRSLLVFRRRLPDPATSRAASEAPALAAPDAPQGPADTAPAPAADASAPSRPRSRLLMAIPSDRAADPATPPAPVLRADRAAPPAEGGGAGPVFRWPLRPGTPEPQPPRPLHTGD